MNRLDRGSIALAVCLAALAGCVDAIGFLQLGGHFVSFMSGNSTQLAVGLVTDRGGAVLELTAIIVLFVIGAGLGTLTAHFARTLQAFAVLAVVAGLLATAAAALRLRVHGAGHRPDRRGHGSGKRRLPA